jgi:cytochrome c biogenesis protein CcdA/thiol-disulfide isomerase/thioredoxin
VIDIALAVLAGTVTVAAPCILPMLPLLLGAAVGQTSRARPVFIVLGFVVAFSAVALVFGLFAEALGPSQGVLRHVAIALLVVFGVLMIWRRPFELVATRLSGLFARAHALAHRAGPGNVGGLVLGMTIGALWTPCAGPVLGSILTLVATAEDPTRAGGLLVAYAIGASLPMLAIAYGGQRAWAGARRLGPYTHRVQQVFGVIVIAMAVAIHYEYDTLVTAWLSNIQAVGSASSGGSALGDHGPAPELAGIETWLNSEPLTMRGLRGKVVLVEFWTYSCVNCVRTLPYITAWHGKYADQGLVIVGVHTPEFAYERQTRNVQAALQRFGITYPVAQDNRYATWKAYDNHYWPASYLVDRNGRIVLQHFGEGHYDEMEQAIRTLLAQRAR